MYTIKLTGLKQVSVSHGLNYGREMSKKVARSIYISVSHYCRVSARLLINRTLTEHEYLRYIQYIYLNV